MKEDTRKIIELHELMNNHEWIPVSRSFQVCKCGMCRGSQSAFNQKPRTARHRRWGGGNHLGPVTDYQTLTQVKSEVNWIASKRAFIDRISEYLIQFPYWAGVYGKRTGNVELMEVMKQDDELLLKHAIETKDYSDVIEARLRNDHNRLIDFLQHKLDDSGDDLLVVAEESRQQILINGGPYLAWRLGKLEGPKDDTREVVCTQENARYAAGYSEDVDGGPSDRIKKALLENVAANTDPKDLAAIRNLECYMNDHELTVDPEIKAAMWTCGYGVQAWTKIVSHKGKLTPAIQKEAIDTLIALKDEDALYTCIRDGSCQLTIQVMEVLLKRNWGGKDLKIPAAFDQEIWNLVCSRPDSGFGRDFLSNWKRVLRNDWTYRIKTLEKEIVDLKTKSCYAEAKLKSKECAAVKAWAHGLLMQYKKMYPSGKDD